MKHFKILFFLLFTSLISFGQNPDYRSRVNIIYTNIHRYLSSGQANLFIETTDPDRNEKPVSYLWPVCALIQAANEMEVLEPEQQYLSGVLNTIALYYNDNPPAPGYQAYIASSGPDTRYIDDNQWIGIAAIDAFQRTDKKEYLDLAELIYRFMMTGYDTISGGGLYWRENDFTTKNTCSNGPGIILALQLYKSTGRKEYLNTALGLYNWTNKYLRTPQGLYYDNIRMKDLSIDSALYTYNVGTMIQSNVLLYHITKKKTYLTEAQTLANAARSYFLVKNKLPDHYWFNAVMLRGFIELHALTGDKNLLDFFIIDAERIWQHERDKNNLLGRRKAKSLIDQAAMLEIYARLAHVTQVK